jgi:molybdenum cofactor biosynthesis enzyme MoaA
MPKGLRPGAPVPAAKLLPFGDRRTARVFIELGVRLRIGGGEPLLRRDLSALSRRSLRGGSWRG